MSLPLRNGNATRDQRPDVTVELSARKYRGLGSVPAWYSSLFEEASRADFFLSLPWFLNFERTIVSEEEPVVVYGIELMDGSNRALGAFPLWNRTPHGSFGPRVLCSLTNYYTPSFKPILNEARSNDIVQTFARALWDDRSYFAAIDLRCFDSDSPVYIAVIRSLKDVGLIVQTYFQFGNWYLDLAGRSYAEYVTGLPPVLKKNIPYQTRRLERTYRIEMKLVMGAEGLEEALTDYETVYRDSWRNQEAYPGFIRGLAEIAARSKALRLGVLYADGVPAAAQFWLVHGGTASIYKIAYVEKFSKYSIGTVLTAHMMRHVIDVDKVTTIDYLSGDDNYKKDWMSHRRERWGIMAFNPRCLGGIVLAARHLGGRRINRMFQKTKTLVP